MRPLKHYKFALFDTLEPPLTPGEHKRKPLRCTGAFLEYTGWFLWILVIGLLATSLFLGAYATYWVKQTRSELGLTQSDNDAKEEWSTSRLASKTVYVKLSSEEVGFEVPTHEPIPTSTRSFSLGTRKAVVDGVEEEIEGYAHFHVANTRPDELDSLPQAAVTGSCYVINSMGTRWKAAAPYYIYPKNRRNMTDTFVIGTVRQGIRGWNEALDNPVFGDYIPETPAVASLTQRDGRNSIHFGSISEPGVIAITTTWGIFSGAEANRKLVEWDMVFDEEDYGWGDADYNFRVMDLLNILMHELGHALGLGDVPDSNCDGATMYAWSHSGETDKRTLSNADIIGLRTLYGQTVSGIPTSPGKREQASALAIAGGVLLALV